MSKLSVITINLNNKPGLERTIKSVLSQTFVDFEYIIIDGASTDGSVDSIRKNEQNIKYWISEKDKGIYNAMNKGIGVARGEYCLFLNSGDFLYEKDVLEKAFEMDFNEDIVYGEQMVYSEGNYKQSSFLDPKYITLNSFLSSTLPHQCTFIKRNLLKKIGLYNENNKIVSDWEFNLLALFKYNSTLRKIHIPISVFDKNGVSNDVTIKEIHENEKLQAILRNFPRIYPDYLYFHNLKKRYSKIPRLIAKVFNKIRK